MVLLLLPFVFLWVRCFQILHGYIYFLKNQKDCLGIIALIPSAFTYRGEAAVSTAQIHSTYNIPSSYLLI